jgi:hypothetical protein
LEFPIQIKVAEITRLRGTHFSHAATQTMVGGYMKGEEEKKKSSKKVRFRGKVEIPSKNRRPYYLSAQEPLEPL